MNRQLLYYLIAIIIILIVISFITTNDIFIKTLISLLLLTIIINIFIKNIWYAFLLALVITIILDIHFYVITNNRSFEFFKNEEKNESEDLPKEDEDEYMKSTKAQKEVYKLIDTSKQLQDILKELIPTVKEGMKVRKLIEQLDLQNKK